MFKRFCFASVGLLALVLTFHLGAETARSNVDCIEYSETGWCFDGPTLAVVTDTGAIQGWYLWNGGELRLETTIPRPGTIAGCRFGRGPGASGVFWLLYADGDMYLYEGNNPGWRLEYNVACSPVSIRPTKWGGVKREFDD